LAQILLSTHIENCKPIFRERQAMTVSFQQTLSNLFIEYRLIDVIPIVGGDHGAD
jgi:hypothetical protein